MKIIKLSFKNINNLKGNHQVDFSSEPLSSAGLFAITGPTGSGKSSLLDVITLALFNKIPRFSKSISKNEISNSGSVLTHHTTDAEAHLTYSVKGRTYTSSWSITTARTGKLKDYEMFIYDSEGKVLDLKKSEVPAHNESIIGLKYDQFIKSILLSQGEFAKFLKANKNERGELLEHITGTSIYRSIGVKAYEKFKISKSELESESALLGEINILSEEEKNNYINETKNIEEKQTEIGVILKEAEKIAQIKSALQQNTQSLKQNEALQININSEFEKFIPFQDKLDLHQKLSPVQGSLASYNSAVANALQSQKNLDSYKAQLATAKDNLRSAISEMQTITKKNVDEANFKKVMIDFEMAINNMDRDLKNIKDRGIEERERNNRLISQYPTQFLKEVKPKEALILLSERKGILEKAIADSQINKNTDLPKTKSNLKQKQNTLESLIDINHGYEHIEALSEKVLKIEKDLKDLNKKSEGLKPLISKCKSLDVTLNDNINLLQKQREDAIKIANLESLRNELHDGTACPLCGSIDHPYSLHLPDDVDDSISKKMEDIKTKVSANNLELDNLNKEYTIAITRIDHNKQSQTSTTNELSEVKKNIEENIKSLKLEEKLDRITLPSLIRRSSAEIEQTEKAIDAIQELTLNEDLKTSYTKLESISKEYRALQTKRKEAFEGSDVNSVTNSLQEKFESNKSKLTELTAVITKETDSLTRDKNLATQIEKELHPRLSSLGFSDISDVSNNLLSEENQQTITQQRDKLNHDRTSIATTIATLKEEQSNLLTQDTKPDVQLQALTEYIIKQKEIKEEALKRKGELSAILKRDEEDQNKIKSKQAKIKKLTAEYEKWSLLKDLIGDANGHKFSNFAQGLTLKNLLVYANIRLKDLSDRYLLDMPGNDDALVIIDQYQGNTSRSVTTLSGGESFLISLSLALSLSDMASKNTSLESLFIDEGFGTLDHDTLELAMTTLEKLQSDSQKTVGVISHVEALKERIHVQIKLNKNAQGYSSIEVVG